MKKCLHLKRPAPRRKVIRRFQNKSHQQGYRIHQRGTVPMFKPMPMTLSMVGYGADIIAPMITMMRHRGRGR